MAAQNTTRGHFACGSTPFVLLRDAPLFLKERGYPQDDGSTYDGCAELAEKATPLYSKLLEEPSAERAAEESEYEVHDEAEAATFHELACYEAGKTSDYE